MDKPTPSYPLISSKLDSLLNSAQKEHVSQGKTIRFYKKGATIFCEGDAPSGIFVVHDGKVKVFKTTLQGEQQIMRLAKAGDLLGYRSLLSSENYTASAQAIEDSHIGFIKRDVFLHLLDTTHILDRELVHTLCNDLRFAEDRLLHFVQKSARERVAETLIFLKESYGKPLKNPEHRMIDIPLSRAEIAELAGVAVETAVRFLSEFKEKKLIRFEGKRIVVLDRETLHKIATTPQE